MAKDAYYHQRFFKVLYRDMIRRMNQYKAIQQIENPELRRQRERRFLEEQRKIIRKFIGQEEYARGKLKEGLKHQQHDIEGWWKRYISFRRAKLNCINRFDNLIAFARKLEEILSKEKFDEKDSQTLISEIEFELNAIIHLSDDYEIRKYGQGILVFCKRNKSPIALTILFIFVSSAAVYIFTNYHLVPKYTQTAQVSFTLDDTHPYDWAQGAHYSYGFHTMLDRIVQHKSYLEGLQYRSYEDQRYGNQDANILEIDKGASLLLPDFMKSALGNNIVMEIQALNKGETVIVIFQDNSIILNVRFNQDKVASIGTNSYNFFNEQLEITYHTIRKGIENRVNSN